MSATDALLNEGSRGDRGGGHAAGAARWMRPWICWSAVPTKRPNWLIHRRGQSGIGGAQDRRHLSSIGADWRSTFNPLYALHGDRASSPPKDVALLLSNSGENPS